MRISYDPYITAVIKDCCLYSHSYPYHIGVYRYFQGLTSKEGVILELIFADVPNTYFSLKPHKLEFGVFKLPVTDPLSSSFPSNHNITGQLFLFNHNIHFCYSTQVL